MPHSPVVVLACVSISLCAFICISVADAQELPQTSVNTVATRDLRVAPVDDGKWEIASVGDITVDAEGRLYVLDYIRQDIKVFSPDGRPLRVLGRKGQGPGEFTYAASITIARDSLWVAEGRTNRITRFSLRDWGFKTQQLTPRVPASVNGPMANGYLANVRVSAGAFQHASRTSDVLFVRLAESGAVLDTLFSVQTAPKPFVVEVVQPNIRPRKVVARRFSTQPFGEPALLSVSADQQRFLRANSERSSSTANGRLSLTAVDLRGDTVWSRSFTFEPTPLSDADVNRVLDSLAKPVAIFGGTMVSADRRMLQDSIARPRNWPAVSSMFTGVDGTLWLKQAGPDRGDLFWRLSSEGVFERVVRIPAGLKLIIASRSQLWGWRLDADSLPVVERYKYQ